MRTIKYLSPTSLNTYETDPHAFFYNYLADTRLPREPQTPAMAVGSSFDAFVKHELYKAIFGKVDDQFEFDTLFESQVEKHNRDEVKEIGQYLFDGYKKVGAYDELLEDILKGESARFEFLVKREVEGVNLLGKPDCLYTRHDGKRVLLDWKVNGYFSKYTTSPAKNYKKVWDTWNEETAKPSRNNGKAHKNYSPKLIGDYEIGATPFEEGGKQWADQLCIYAWVLKEPVGTDVIVAVDQLACKPSSPRPLVRVAQHRGQLSKLYQNTLLHRLQTAWNNIQNGHIFMDMSKEENDQELENLNKAATLMDNNELFKALKF